MKSTKFLIQEHKLILRALDVLDSMAAWAEKNGTIDQIDIGNIRLSSMRKQVKLNADCASILKGRL